MKLANEPLSTENKALLKKLLKQRKKYQAVAVENHRRDSNGKPKLKLPPKLDAAQKKLFKLAKAEHPELVTKYNAQLTKSNKKKQHRKQAKVMQRKADKLDPVKTRLQLEAVADAEDLFEATIVERELATRQFARRRLIACVIRFNPDYLAGWVHKDICARLERFMLAVEEGRNPRLMLQMPPRHGKSTLASIEFPSFVLGHHPNWEVIVTSYAETLALDFSRAVRARLRDPEYQVLFPNTKMDPENQNAKGWKTRRKGGFLPAGVEGPITGKGAHILIIDDPIKNSQEADSELKRSGILKWYASTAYTRLAPGGGVLIIQTRWHLDDLSGRLESDMAEGNGDVFEVVRYPAVAVEDEKWRKKGDPLHQARYSHAQLKMIKKAVGLRTWAALYQQNPVPEQGAQFQESMFQYYQPAELPDLLTKVSAWDLAIGQKEVNDKTVGFTWGKDIVGDYWFVDCRHGHFEPFEIVEEIGDNYIKHNPYTVGIESDKVSMALGPLLDTLIEDRELYGLHVTELRPMIEGNKVKRARTLQGLMRQGKVHIPYADTADWVEEFVTELLQFPYGRRDDHVDAAAWLALMGPETPSPGLAYSKVPKRVTWRDRLKTMTRGDRSMMSS